MARTCPHCGMESDRDKTCSWCSKPLAQEKPAAASAAPAAPPPLAEGPAAAPAPTPRPSPPRPPAPKVREPIREPLPAWLYFAAALIALLLIGVVVNCVAAAKAAGPPPPPAQWQALQSKTKLLSLQGPSNWKFVTAGSSASYEQAELRGGPLCVVSIHGSQSKGSLGDMMGASSNLARGSEVERRPEGKLHAFLGVMVRKEDKHYAEGDLQGCTFAGMPAAYSEYTSLRRVGLFAVKVKGWRLACSGGDLGYDIRAEAPEKQWDGFKPTAEKILGSVAFGSGT